MLRREEAFGEEPYMQLHFDDLIQRAIYSGAAAGLASAGAASTAAVRAGHEPCAAINAVSHCLSPKAIWREEPSVRYSALGATIHMGSAAV